MGGRALFHPFEQARTEAVAFSSLAAWRLAPKRLGLDGELEDCRRIEGAKWRLIAQSLRFNTRTAPLDDLLGRLSGPNVALGRGASRAALGMI
jgi:hypothetical protein